MEQSIFQQAADLAEAIRDGDWRPQYLRLGDDGRSKIQDGWAASVSEAAQSGRSFMVKARRDIVVIDNDTDVDGGVTVWEFLEEFPSYEELLPVVSSSGGEGRWHLLVRIEDPAEREGFIRDAKGFGFLDVQAGRWIRPPMAPHPAGGSSTLVKMEPSFAVAALRDTRELPRRLGARVKVALYLGPSGFTSRDASSVLMTITLGMVATGWTDERTMFDTLRRYPGGASLQRRIENGWSVETAFEWWQQHTLTKARKRVALSPTIREKSDAWPTLGGLKEWAGVHQWRGIGGATDRLVLEHLLRLAIGHGRVHGIGASVRQVAEAIGVSHPTVGRSLHRLQDLGVLQRNAREDTQNLNGYEGPLANRYSIKVPPFANEVEAEAWHRGTQDTASLWNMNQSDPGGVCEATGSTTIISSAHDAFRHGALSKTKYLVLTLLDGEPKTARQIANLLGKDKDASLQTLYGHLRVLTELGLANKVEQGWVVGTLDLDAIAEQRGTAGKGEHQRAEHEASRSRAVKAHKKKHRQLLTSEEFADRFIVPATDGRMVSDSEVRGVYLRWLRTLKGRGPRRTKSWQGIDPWDEIQARWPQAYRFYVGNTGMWSGIRLVSPRNLPKLPPVGEAIHFATE